MKPVTFQILVSKLQSLTEGTLRGAGEAGLTLIDDNPDFPSQALPVSE